MYLLFSKLAQLSSTINVFTSVLLGLAYFAVSVRQVWYLLLARIKLLENKTFKTALTQDSRKTCTWTVNVHTNVYWERRPIVAIQDIY